MRKEIEAAHCWLKRKDRMEHPSGDFDGPCARWYPSASERQECCGYIYIPSRAYPYSYMKHCRSQEHVANLYGVSLRMLSLALYLLRKDAAQDIDIILRTIEITERMIGPITNQRALTMARRYKQAA